MPKIFVSHAAQDSHLVAPLIGAVERLMQKKVSFFLSSRTADLPAGTDWWTAICQELRTADVVLLMLSRTSAERPWLLFEFGHAVGKGSQLISVILDDLPISDVQSPLNHYQVERLPSNFDDATGYLRQLLTRLLNEGRSRGMRAVLQLGNEHYPLDQGWERYGGSGLPPARTNLGVGFGTSFDDAFRTPHDRLSAPWEFLAFRAASKQVHLYFVLQLTDGDYIKIYASHNHQSWGFVADPRDEFRVPVPTGRSAVILRVRSFIPLFGSYPRPGKLVGLRVRGPSILTYIGAAAEERDVRIRRRATILELPKMASSAP